MPNIADLIAQGAANPWLYLPFAVLLGALHALEPGHSKSMMAAFVVAVRGTKRQAALLGLCAAIGHTVLIWLLAALGLWLGDKLIIDKAEPWLILASGVLILVLSVRIYRMTGCGHDHGHDHGHSHGPECGHDHSHGEGTVKAMGAKARAKEAAATKKVSNWDIAWFGLTGGLLPCPSALAVLLVCLQMRAFTLGFAMVAGFSIGLAATLIAVGVLAAWGATHARQKWSAFDKWGERIPYISSAMVALIGVVVTVRGLMALGVF